MNHSALQEKTSTITAWVVEDEQYLRDVCQAMIEERRRYSCPRTFERAEEAIVALQNVDQQPDVILLDIGLPGMSGLEALPKMKALSPQTHIIILTVYHDEMKLREALQSGASGYLTKDEFWIDIPSLIEQVMHGETVLSASMQRKVLDEYVNVKIPAEDFRLTDREREVLLLAERGLSNKEIEEKLWISFFTVNDHLKSIFKKMNVHSVREVMAKLHNKTKS
jgi:DNA-binding NarL/FixJ family response regulator